MKVKRIAVASAALVLFTAAAALTQAPQTPPAAQAPAAAPVGRGGPPLQAIVPVAASTLAADPDPFVGHTVTVTAPVGQRLGATAFSLEQNPAAHGGQAVLVLAPLLNGPIEPHAYLTVIGEVVRFDATAIAGRMKDAMPVLGPDVAAAYRGRAAIIASSVINTAMTDLAKRLPPPMTPEELALSKVMKQIGPGFTALRQSVTGSNADAAAQAGALKTGFTQAAAFWKSQPHPDAMQWNEDAKRASAEIETSAAKGDWDAVKSAIPKLQGICTSCHAAYRERLDDGTYRFKTAGR